MHCAKLCFGLILILAVGDACQCIESETGRILMCGSIIEERLVAKCPDAELLLINADFSTVRFIGSTGGLMPLENITEISLNGLHQDESLGSMCQEPLLSARVKSLAGCAKQDMNEEGFHAVNTSSQPDDEIDESLEMPEKVSEAVCQDGDIIAGIAVGCLLAGIVMGAVMMIGVIRLLAHLAGENRTGGEATAVSRILTVDDQIRNDRVIAMVMEETPQVSRNDLDENVEDDGKESGEGGEPVFGPPILPENLDPRASVKSRYMAYLNCKATEKYVNEIGIDDVCNLARQLGITDAEQMITRRRVKELRHRVLVQAVGVGSIMTDAKGKQLKWKWEM